jgi:glycerate dehydrogenase
MMTEAPLIVFLDQASFPEHIRIRPPAAPHRWLTYDSTAPDQVAERIAGARAVVVNKVRISAQAMDAAPDLGLIAVTATGMDNVDQAAAAARGVLVRNVAGYAVGSVPEHALMLILALARRLGEHQAAVREGDWTRSGQFCVFPAPIRDLAGMRLGLIGGGAIAGALARKAEALGLEVVFAERRGAAEVRSGRLAFETVLATSDVISLHCPLTPETRGMIDATVLAAMKPGAILINTARGALIDEAALEAALDAGHIGGAGLDVAPTEPPPEGAPILRLAARPNVIVTPHVAWASDGAMRALADQVTANIQAFLTGADA